MFYSLVLYWETHFTSWEMCWGVLLLKNSILRPHIDPWRVLRPCEEGRTPLRLLPPPSLSFTPFVQGMVSFTPLLRSLKPFTPTEGSGDALRPFPFCTSSFTPTLVGGRSFTPLIPPGDPFTPSRTVLLSWRSKMMLKVFCLIWEDSRAQWGVAFWLLDTNGGPM